MLPHSKFPLLPSSSSFCSSYLLSPHHISERVRERGGGSEWAQWHRRQCPFRRTDVYEFIPVSTVYKSFVQREPQLFYLHYLLSEERFFRELFHCETETALLPHPYLMPNHRQVRISCDSFSDKDPWWTFVRECTHSPYKQQFLRNPKSHKKKLCENPKMLCQISKLWQICNQGWQARACSNNA